MTRLLHLAAFALFCAPLLATAEENVPRMLFITQSEGFVHPVVRREEGTRSMAELTMLQLARDSGAFTVYCSQNAAADFTKENLENFDIVAFYTSGDLPIDEETFAYFRNDWLTREGHGFLGFHSATDTFKNFEPYWDLVGGTFNGHPWNASAKVTLTVHDPDHPTMKPFDSRFDFQDEIYQYSHWQPEKVRVLMSLDMQHTSLKRPYHVPVAWCKAVGDGKLFYTNLGHRDSTWKDKRYRESIVAAVRWINNEVPGTAKPNPEVSAAQHRASIKHAEAAGVTQAALDAAQKANAAQ